MKNKLVESYKEAKGWTGDGGKKQEVTWRLRKPQMKKIVIGLIASVGQIKCAVR